MNIWLNGWINELMEEWMNKYKRNWCSIQALCPSTQNMSKNCCSPLLLCSQWSFFKMSSLLFNCLLQASAHKILLTLIELLVNWPLTIASFVLCHWVSLSTLIFYILQLTSCGIILLDIQAWKGQVAMALSWPSGWKNSQERLSLLHGQLSCYNN